LVRIRLQLSCCCSLGLALLAACSADPEPADDDDIYDIPDDDDIFDMVPGEAGWPCPNGPVDCGFDLGCHQEVCGLCSAPEECRGGQGCREDGVCGACTADAQCPDDTACRSGFCVVRTVPQWDLEIAASDLEIMDEDPYARVFVPAVLTADEVTYDQDVQIRYLGSSTLAFPKKSFRIEFPEAADHPGYARRINLRAEYNDPSFLRTYLGYETVRRMTLLPTPRARYVNVSLNGVNYGLMLEVERVGGKFLEAHGRDREQSMYEGKETSPWGALMPMSDEAEYREYYAKTTGDAEDWSDLIGLVEENLWLDHLDSQPWGPTGTARTREVIAIDSYIEYLAALAAIQSQDHVTNNYFLSWQNVPGVGWRWEFYPWDMDLTFGCLWDDELSTSLCSSTLVYDDWWLNGVVVEPTVAGQPNSCWCNLPAHLVLNDPELGGDYIRQLCRVIASEWWTDRLPDLAAALGQTLESRVLADTNDRNQTLDDWAVSRAQVLAFMVERKAFLETELGCP
jgi:hypothetical protein